MNNSGPSSKLCTQLKCEEKFSNKKACITVRNGRERMERKRGGRTRSVVRVAFCWRPSVHRARQWPTKANDRWGPMRTKEGGHHTIDPSASPWIELRGRVFHWKKNKAYAFVKIFSIFYPVINVFYRIFFSGQNHFFQFKPKICPISSQQTYFNFIVIVIL